MPHLLKKRVNTGRTLAALILIAGAGTAMQVTASAAEEIDVPYQVADSNNLPTRIPGLGTFSGGISARQFKGNGIYFSIDGSNRYGSGQADSKKSGPRPGAKIIDMQDAQRDMDCDNPGDVCIIRP